MKVWKMDDYTWYVAQTEDEAIEAWENDCGEKYDQELYDERKECNIDTEGLWLEISDNPDIVPDVKDVKVKFGVIARTYFGVCKYISFREAIGQDTTARCIACTEA